MSILDYGVNDIKTLEGIEAIRLRPGMTSFEQCRIEKINAFLTSIYAYEKCEKQKGDFCNEPRCEHCIITLGNGYSLTCGKNKITCGHTPTSGIKVSFTDFVPALVRNGKLIFINFYDIIER